MADEQIKELCEKIYRQHREAIDLIISNLPNQREVARAKLIELIEANESLTLDDCSAASVRFIPKALDLPYFQATRDWTSSMRILLFEFTIAPKSIVLTLQMGPGDVGTRKHIHDFACAETKILHVEGKFYPKWQSLYKKLFVSGLKGGVDHDELIDTIEGKWKEFLDSDLPLIEQVFLSHQWPANQDNSD